MLKYTVDSLLADILDGRLDPAVADLSALAAEQGFPAVLHEILEPALRITGEMWAESRISLAQSYVAGKITEIMLERFLQQDAEHASRVAHGTLVIGNIEDDFHVLGRRMVSAFLRLQGWTVLDLGNDVPAADFVDAALANQACIIAVSAMMLSTARNIRGVREELDRRGLSGRIQLAVGGAIFRLRPDLVSELGGDGTTDTAMDAPALMERLEAAALACRSAGVAP